MSFNVVIGLGNTGTQIVKLAAASDKLTDTKFYTIDSVAANADVDSVQNITAIPIVSDDKSGSGRLRERGAAMFELHDQNHAFDQLYKDALEAKEPIIIVTSAAGGTGSGITPVLCEKLFSLGKRNEDTGDEEILNVVPLIICPSLKDPDAFHMNAADLMVELQDVGVTTYSIFRNEYGTANYDQINRDVATTIELILGKLYDSSENQTIDESDLDVMMRVPGRFVAVYAESDDPHKLKRMITEKALHSYQPTWNVEDTKTSTIYTAFALTSPFAKDDFADIFADVRTRIEHYVDEYRNICERDGKSSASIIVAGLPRAELGNVDAEYHETKGIADGVKQSARPSFMNKKKPIRKSHLNNGDKTGFANIDKYDWK